MAQSPLQTPARARSSTQPAPRGPEPSGWTVIATPSCRLWNAHPARRRRTPTAFSKIGGQFVEQPGHPVLLDVGQGGLVDARSAIIAAHRGPRPLQNVSAVDLVP